MATLVVCTLGIGVILAWMVSMDADVKLLRDMLFDHLGKDDKE